MAELYRASRRNGVVLFMWNASWCRRRGVTRFVIALTIAVVAVSAPRAQAQTSTPASVPLSRTAAVPLSSVRMSLPLDSATVVGFDVRTFDLGIARAATGSTATTNTTTNTELQLIKVAGPYTDDLLRLGTEGTHLPWATIDVLDSLGRPQTTLHFTDVSVVSDHVSYSGARATLEQQRISLEESLSQLTSEHQEAERDLATAEALGRTRVTTRQDLERAREHSADVQRRLDLAKQRQTLLARQLDAVGALDEAVVFHVGGVSVESTPTVARTLRP